MALVTSLKSKNPCAGQYWHRQDHGKSRLCNSWFNPMFLLIHKHVRSFQQDKFDENKIEIIIGSKGKGCERRHEYSSNPPPNDTGPAEMITLTIEFIQPLLGHESSGGLCFDFHTLSQIMDDTFSDSIISPSDVIRTVSHGIPLRRMRWIDKERQFTNLPSGLFNFLGSEISTRSRFSCKLMDIGTSTSVAQWPWMMLSFELKLSIPRPLWTPLSAKASIKSNNRDG